MPGLSTWPTGMGTGAGWPTATGDAGSDLVSVRRPLRGQDASGGRTVRYPDAWLPDVLSATVRAVKGNEVDQFAREGTVISYKVTLNVRLAYRDQIRWEETGDVLTVIAAVASGTQAARTWDHYCEERGA